MWGILRRHQRSGENMTLDVMTSNLFYSTLPIKNIFHDFDHGGFQRQRLGGCAWPE